MHGVARHLAILLLFFCAAACKPKPVEPRAGRVAANGVTLSTIDWGGSGEPLVFVAGLGATAHAFDDFAPRFTDRFHVIGVTRRADEALAATPGAYATDTLADDLDAALRSLGLASANVVAHSFGGAEATCLATRHPDRVRRLVYLDAAYDHAKSLALYGQFPDVPPPPAPTAEDARSAAAYVAYLDRTFGLRMPAGEASASFTFAGGRANPTVPGPVFGALVQQERLCAYADVRAPALGVFAMLDTPGDLARFVRDDPEIARKSKPLFDALAARQREDIDRFERETPRREVLPLHGAHHWVFASNADAVERAMRGFLAR